MKGRSRARAATDEKSIERVFTMYLRRDEDPEHAGREAADEAFDGLAAIIKQIVAQQVHEEQNQGQAA